VTPPPDAPGDLALTHLLRTAPADVNGDVIEISTETWAIHGYIAYDGDVLLAEYDNPNDARAALGRLAVLERMGDAVIGRSAVVAIAPSSHRGTSR
jgi:hypothetical protein